VLYLHGLASSPASHKGLFFRERLEAAGATVQMPDLNEGDFTGLTTSRAVALATRLAGQMPAPRVVLGSSFGGRVAIHTAAALHRKVSGLLLMAPALRFRAVWERTQTPAALARWREQGEVPVEHPAYDGEVALGYGFYEDALRTEVLDAQSTQLRVRLPPNLPVLILHGRGDEVVPLADSERFAALHGGTTLITLDSDHGLIDQTERLWQKAVQWLLQHILLDR
jgi:hypothetical protein